MIWVKATKTKLYRLIAEHIYLPKLKDTNFIEVNSRSAYCLEWHAPNGIYYRAFYLFASNSPRLVIQYRGEKQKSFNNFLIRKLDIDDLVTRGMIKGVRSMHQITKLQMIQYQDANNFMYDDNSYVTLSQTQANEHISTAM